VIFSFKKDYGDKLKDDKIVGAEQRREIHRDILVGQPEREKSVRKSRYRWKNNIKIDLK
jgi:hypothetical protein